MPVASGSDDGKNVPFNSDGDGGGTSNISPSIESEESSGSDDGSDEEQDDNNQDV